MERDKKTEIIFGVWHVIATEGLAAVSVRSVASAAGVSAGRVQHYFPTKTALVRASAETMLQTAVDSNPLTQENPANPSTLRALLMHALEPAASKRVGTGVYYSYVAAAVADPWIANLLADAKQGLIGAVEACVRSQYPGMKDAELHARELVFLSDGVGQAVFLGAVSGDEGRRIIDDAIGRLCTR